MNLHDLNQPRRPWGLVHPRFADAELAFAETLRYLRRQDPIDLVTTAGVDLAVRADMTFDMVDYTVRARDRAEGLQVGRILADLERQYFALVRGRIDQRDMNRAAFVMDRHEADLLRRSLTVEELGRHGFNTQEGARNSYRGYPLVVTGW